MNYSNTIVSIMLGWMRGIANWAINLFNTSGTRRLSMLSWFSEHWIPFLVALVIIGIVMDWLIWIIRWRPYWVWFRTRRIIVDDGADTESFHRPGKEDNWDGLEDDEREEMRRRQRVRHHTYQRKENDFFSVDPETAMDFDDRTGSERFRSKANHDISDDPFSISSDDPDAITFWQDGVFNTEGIRDQKDRSRTRRS